MVRSSFCLKDEKLKQSYQVCNCCPSDINIFHESNRTFYKRKAHLDDVEDVARLETNNDVSGEFGIVPGMHNIYDFTIEQKCMFSENLVAAYSLLTALIFLLTLKSRYEKKKNEISFQHRICVLIKLCDFFLFALAEWSYRTKSSSYKIYSKRLNTKKNLLHQIKKMSSSFRSTKIICATPLFLKSDDDCVCRSGALLLLLLERNKCF